MLALCGLQRPSSGAICHCRSPANGRCWLHNDKPRSWGKVDGQALSLAQHRPKMTSERAMTDLRVVTNTGTEKFFENATIENFAEGLRGPLLRAGDPDYEAARQIWNGMINRRPALIA